MLFILLLSAVVILSAIFTNKFLDSIGVPSLLFFIFLGIIFGTEISYQNFQLTKEICSAALGFIIFYGGFCTKWETARPIIAKAGVLSTLGVLLTAGLTGLFCHFLFKLGVWESFLIGAVISSTDAASVFSILKGKRLGLKENTAPLLEIESGSNDPMSYILVILAITLLQGKSADFVAILFFKQMIIGILTGVIISKMAVFVFRKTNMIIEGNDTLFIISLILTSYSIPILFDGNPFLAVYFLGIILGNSEIPNKISMMNFFDGITKLAQIGIFFMLGLLAFPSEVFAILKTGTLVFLFLTFIARPIVVFLLLYFFKSSIRQSLLVSWAGLRGVASIVFAIVAMDSGIKLNYDLFHIVFLISILSVALQGTLLPLVARVTDMLDPLSNIRKTFNDYHEECAVRLLHVTVPADHEWIGKEIKDINFPGKSLAILIRRNGQKIIPNNKTIINSGDSITLSLPGEV